MGSRALFYDGRRDSAETKWPMTLKDRIAFPPKTSSISGRLTGSVSKDAT
jgi:hypothetical protein